jgi:hypothetical protein
MSIAGAVADFSTGYPQETETAGEFATFSLLYETGVLVTVTLKEKIKSNICKTSSDTKIVWTSIDGG